MRSKTTDELIQDFIEDSVFLKEYTSINNFNNPDFDPKYSVKIGKRAYKNLKLILKDEMGIDKLIPYLDDNNILISSSVAEYLYPIYPDKCISILYKYLDTLNEELDRIKVEETINGCKENLVFFTNGWVDLYGENWHELNRENEKENS